MTGDPYVQCVPSKWCFYSFVLRLVLTCHILPSVKIGECRVDSECPDNRACIEHQCEDPCYVPYEPCGSEAKCEAIRHRAVCTCPTGWAGNPHDICFQCRLISIIFIIITYSNWQFCRWMREKPWLSCWQSMHISRVCWPMPHNSMWSECWLPGWLPQPKMCVQTGTAGKSIRPLSGGRL